MSTKKLVACLFICLVLLCGCAGYLLYEFSFTHGVYEINITSLCTYNDCVGNEWHESYTMDGKSIFNGYKVTSPLDRITAKTVNVTITEQDKRSDSSTKDITITLKNNESKTSTIYVVENNGRYKDNIAIWEFTVSVKLIKRIRQ